MDKEVILNIAMSLDGYIADEKGGVNWIDGDGSNPEVTMTDMGFNYFLSDVKNIIMGYASYEVTKSFEVLSKQYPNKNIYVMTKRHIDDNDVITTKESTNQLLKKVEGVSWLFGGGRLVNSFLKEDLVTKLELTIIPIMIGNGIPLFREMDHKLKWEFIEQAVYNGMVVLKYSRKDNNESR